MSADDTKASMPVSPSIPEASPLLPNHAQDKSCQEDNDRDGTKSSPIFEAVKSGLLASVQTIVQKQGDGVLWSHDNKGYTPAHWACLGGHTPILRFIIEHKGPVDEASSTDLGVKPIHWASVHGHIAVVDVLILAGVCIDTADNKGCTPLIVACQYGHTPLAGYLMGKGARLPLADKDGDTALHWAAFKGHRELITLLIYSGFDPRQKDTHGQTPLHLACINGDIATVKCLCQEDRVQLDPVDNNGQTPLVLALGRKHEAIVKHLKQSAQRRTNFLPRMNIRTIIFGPGNSKSPILFFLVCTLLWGYPMYIFRGLPETFDEFPTVHIFFIVINIIMWLSLYHANSIDPGFLPRNIPEYDQAITQVARFDEWKQGASPLARLCHTCRTIKIPRAKHCKFCNRCVREFDHHCPYIYNCVGYHNRGSFVLFSACIVILGQISMFLSYHVMEKEGFPLRPDYLLGVGLYVFFEGVAIFIFGSSIIHASRNITTNEIVNKKRYDYLKDHKGNFHNPYNKGVKHNLMEYFHLRKSHTPTEVSFLDVDM